MWQVRSGMLCMLWRRCWWARLELSVNLQLALINIGGWYMAATTCEPWDGWRSYGWAAFG